MDKIVLIGDTHFGAKSDSPKYNQQLIDMLEWVCGFDDVDGAIQMGDFFDNRSKIKIDTLNYAIHGAKILKNRFGKENVYCLAGNHDLHYLSRLDVSSLASIDEHVTVVDSITPINNMLLVPWIASGEMWDQLVDESDQYDYCFGHFELNGFQVNEAYTMEHGYSPKGLKKFKSVFSGHYHSYQKKDNITYLGTPLPITQNESNEKHGVFIFDTNTGDLEFREYDKVKVVSIPYTAIESLNGLDPYNTSVRIEFPDDLEDETLITEAQEWLKDHEFTDAKIKYRGSKVKQLLEGVDESEVKEVENIDEVVLSFIRSSSKVEGIDNDRLEKYYLLATNGEVMND